MEGDPMEKVKLGAVPLVYPIPIVLVGANVDGRANFAEIGDCAIIGIRPALVAVSLSNTHHTTRGIDAHGVFSINFPSQSMLSKTHYCGTVSGKDVDKSGLFDLFEGDQTEAPMIQDCPVGLECRVREAVQVEHRRIFIADVLECYVSEPFVTVQDGKKRIADLPSLDPILYALDNQYYRVGSAIGTGEQEGESVPTG
jgi:flavin reductase (DIM6/NTAB) family NADH-FMN oxidoreductase RutF